MTIKQTRTLASRINLIFLIVLTQILSSNYLFAANNRPYNNNFGIGLQIGSWKPNSLSDEPTVSPFGEKGARPYYGFSLSTPKFGSYILRANIGLWTYTETPNVIIVPISLDLKHQLIGQGAFSPYVCYGATLFLGAEKELTGISDLTNSGYESGFGIILGVGFDLSVFSHWSIFIEFDLHYAKFRQNIGATDDYSGPKLLAGFNYIF